MNDRGDAFDGLCPCCGHVFLLAELKRMAIGDGWQRHLWVEMPDGEHRIVSFDDYNPAIMEPYPKWVPGSGPRAASDE